MSSLIDEVTADDMIVKGKVNQRINGENLITTPQC